MFSGLRRLLGMVRVEQSGDQVKVSEPARQFGRENHRRGLGHAEDNARHHVQQGEPF